ncbi:MAG: hypothetical protein K6F69_02875 [Treponema sp.]|nr:hypothetical protein [Treponema sp.]
MRNFSLALVLSMAFLSVGCSGLVSDVVDEESSIVVATESDSWSYDSASPVYELSSSTKSLTISGLPAGKTLYLTKTNPTSSSIESSAVRYVSSATNVELTDSSNSGTTSYRAMTVENSINLEMGEIEVGDVEFSSSKFLAPASYEANVLTPVVDTTENTIYVDHGINNGTLSCYSLENVVLRAVGEKCYVWVAESSYKSSGTCYGKAINSSRAKLIASKFDAMYDEICGVFGNEADELLLSASSNETISMNKASNTGTMINIVVYDIGNDFSKSSSNTIVGYFHSKDYYASGIANFSNSGKYIYLDSYFAACLPAMTYSTLAHEFQHMINWNMKRIQKGLKSSTWYNEMLSMLCEDMMQKSLSIKDSYSPKNRLATFESYYRYSGLEYNNSATLVSYASVYAFGAWLVREFGGQSLLYAMSHNDSVDIDSVVSAVNEVNASSYEISDLLRFYTEACVFNENNDSYEYPTFNQNKDTMTAIDLWNISYCDGPALYGFDSQSALRPYGMDLIEIGTIESSSEDVTLTFSSEGSASQKLYVLVQ